jgi:hypothetical protein
MADIHPIINTLDGRLGSVAASAAGVCPVWMEGSEGADEMAGGEFETTTE